MEKEKNKTVYIYEQVKSDIIKGKLGESGSVFISVREFAKKYCVSYVTAQRLVLRLREEGYLILSGKKTFITFGRIKESSPLAETMHKKGVKKKYIGLHINTVNNIFFASIAEKLNNYLAQKGYGLIIMSSCGSYENEKNILNSFVELGTEGIISFSGHDKRTGELYRKNILPTLLIGTDDRNIGIPSVFVDNKKGAKMVAKYLVESGYKTFGYVGTKKLSFEKDMRLNGFKDGLKENGVLFTDNIFSLDTASPKESRGELKQFILKAEKPLGLFCYHDAIAAEMYDICRKYKLRIPEDVGIVGFDDLPIANILEPKLTTVAYRYDVMAETAVNVLLEMIKKGVNAEKAFCIRPVLSVRESTKK